MYPNSRDKNCYFIFTDNRLAFCMPQSVLKKTICLNSKDVITSLAHKLVFRNAFSDYVDMLPYKFVPYDMLRNKQAIDKLFGYENDDYVVQNFINNGGANLFISGSYDCYTSFNVPDNIKSHNGTVVDW